MTTAIDNAMGTAKEALGSAKNVAEGAAYAVKGTVIDTADDASKNVKKVVSFLRHIDLDDIVGLVGLRRKRSPLAAIALVGGGILVGAGIAMLMSPVSGKDTRKQIRMFFEGLSGRAMDEVTEVKEKAAKVAGDVKEKASEVATDVKEKVGQAQEKVGEVVTQAREGAEGTEGAQADEGKGRRRHNQNAQVS